MEERKKQEGRILLVDKPYKWTSFAVVNKLRYRFRIKKIGHAGTLDPLATGLLIICTHNMTKRIEDFMGLEKEYTGKFTIGSVTASHDLETPVSEPKDISSITDELIHVTVKSLTGRISQLPPAHSAIRVGGKRAYDFAREGKEIILSPREVEIKEFEITSIALPVIGFRIVCSKGTYIRSLARDLGEKLGVGAYLSELCRTRIGPYKLSDAQTIEEATA
ncbi:MAG TPA: tRNA pseudouridine(55) synthase TruB [Cyclobacteriaceae bacterium]|nr:tRNA pseudouridine(55) synthase TruB [Cyclobacteriaceae bacterium]